MPCGYVEIIIVPASLNKHSVVCIIHNTVSPPRMNEFHSKSMFISPICKSNKVSPSTQLTQLAIIELYSNRFIIFIIQIIYNTKNKTFLIL